MVTKWLAQCALTTRPAIETLTQSLMNPDMLRNPSRSAIIHGSTAVKPNMRLGPALGRNMREDARRYSASMRAMPVAKLALASGATGSGPI